jgi:UDP-N-acetylglucosamine 2-epimerase (non-hydrolysing)
MITVLYGTRPEAIKLAPVVNALRARSAPVTVVCTGQHRELLEGMPIEPDIELHLMRENQTPSGFLSRAMTALDAHLFHTQFVLVQGDTTTAFAGALSAYHMRIPIGHVEAGLRTGRLDAPFPEEGYRQMVDRIATRLYAPTERAAQNLVTEGRQPADILITGNTGIDAAMQAKGRVRPGDHPFVLVTVHRREASAEQIESICCAIRKLAVHTGMTFVVPVHPNQNGSRIRQALDVGLKRIEIIPPMNYADTIATMKLAACVLTDSGGLQEEAPTFGVPVVVVREVTERPEGVEAGVAILAGFDEDLIFESVMRMASTKLAPIRLYGDGHAAPRIAEDAAVMGGS